MLDQTSIESNQNRFIGLLQDVDRPGIDNLVTWLKSTDFFTAPASTKFHGNYPGGLCEHSLQVYDTAIKLRELMTDLKPSLLEHLPLESVTIASLIHDICKVYNYYPKEKWRKDPQNNWESYPGYEVQDKFPIGHGEKSVILAMYYIRLTAAESLAIRWHMGQTEPSTQIQGMMKYAYDRAINDFPLVSLIVHADGLAALHLQDQRM